MNKNEKTAYGCLLMIFYVFVIFCVNPLVFAFLWQYSVSSITGAPVLTYQQALASTLMLAFIGSYFKVNVKEVAERFK